MHKQPHISKLYLNFVLDINYGKTNSLLSGLYFHKEQKIPSADTWAELYIK